MGIKEIGRMIKKIRIERGMSQQELANRIGVSWEMISRYERGRSSPLQKITQLADVLHVPLGTFFVDEFSNHDALHDSNNEFMVGRNLVPLLQSLPENPANLHQVILTTPYFFSPSLPALSTYQKKSLFALDLNAIADLTVKIEGIQRKGFLLCALLPTNEKEQLGQRNFLMWKNNSYVVAQYSDFFKTYKHIGVIVSYTLVF